MGLYLCIFKGNEELEGVEVGAYEYFGVFRDNVRHLVETNEYGSVCPTVMLHSDCDGSWAWQDCKALMKELSLISEVFKRCPPQKTIIEMKKELFDENEIYPESLYDCFIDVDGENLIERLMELCLIAIDNQVNILFQ